MWLNKNDNTVIAKPIAIEVNGVTYPKVIFGRWNESELNAIGIYTPTIDPIPNRRYYTYAESIDFNTNTIMRTPIAKSLADIQATMKNGLDEYASQKFDSATSGYSASEMASWSILENEAKQHLVTPLIEGLLVDEALMAGITTTYLANKVLANATDFRGVKAYMSGTRAKKSAEVSALVDVNACIAYENEAYSYTITTEDVANDIDGTLVEGTVVTRYRNNLKDW